MGNINSFLTVFKQRLIDTFVQEWLPTVRDKERYEMYRSYKYEFGREKYLLDIDIFCFRVALTQIRLGVLPINSNMYRYSENPKDRRCVNCTSLVENEHHFVYTCPLYNDLRKRFMENVLNVTQAFGRNE